eukprot:GHVN01100249.1.p1 GENE.GHVN01100249.1~~GHVN01100249.1.p1  ORF type:complete len:103 (-),score=3.82 GHVN01100249.1:136-444(-)
MMTTTKLTHGVVSVTSNATRVSTCTKPMKTHNDYKNQTHNDRNNHSCRLNVHVECTVALAMRFDHYKAIKDMSESVIIIATSVLEYAEWRVPLPTWVSMVAG